MSKYNLNIYINSNTSKMVLNSIIHKQKINYNKLKISHLKKSVESLQEEYNTFIKKKIMPDENIYKHFVFWEIVKKKFKKKIFTLVKRKQVTNLKKTNIIFPDVGKVLGYNPSLLSLLIFHKEINDLLSIGNFFNDLQKAGELENVDISKKLKIIDVIKKKEVNIITPLCPDYEHIKMAFGLYKYTFNKLNDGLGLIGKRLVKVINSVHDVFNKYDIKFNHHLYYGDFESYSKKNCDRLNITEDEFLSKLIISKNKMVKAVPSVKKVALLVNEMTTKKNWIRLCSKNEKKIKNKFVVEINFRRKILNIAASRSALYSLWYPKMDKRNYVKLVIQQGAEYATMGDIFGKKLKNPFILGLDHPKMSIFYNENCAFPVVYGRPKYV